MASRRARTSASSCLIDGGSASASEIVAGALQDIEARDARRPDSRSARAPSSSGRSSSGEGGAFKLTIARWLTPDKRWIHGTGLTPDVAVEVPADLPAGEDPTLDKALEVLGATADAGVPCRRLTRGLAPASRASGTVLGNERR